MVRVHPNAITAFRHSRGIKAKTDPIDARLVLAFTVEGLARGGLRTTILGDRAVAELAARRRQLADTLHAERSLLGDRLGEAGAQAAASATSRSASFTRSSPEMSFPPSLSRPECDVSAI